MSYELLRTDFHNALRPLLPEELLETVLRKLDESAQKYDVRIKETQLALVNKNEQFVKDFIAAKATENVKKGTLVNYYSTLKYFFMFVNKEINMIETNDIRLYLYAYKEKRHISDRTLERHRSVLNNFFEWLKEEEKVKKNPVKRIQTIKYQITQRHKMTPIELEELRFACKTLREKALVDFMFSTGCRVQELCDVNITDVDFYAKTVRILHGKGDKERVVYLNPESTISLKAYLNARTDNCPSLFVNERVREKRKMSKRSVEVALDKVVKRTGITQKITPHILRHTCATTAIRNGMPVEQVQKMLGHAKISTTMIYAQVDDTDVKRNHQRCVI